MKKTITTLAIFSLSLKISAQVLWGTYYGTSSEIGQRSVCDKINNVVYTTGLQATGGFWAKYNLAGTLISSGNFGNGSLILPNDITVDNNGNFYIMGHCDATATGIATGGAHQGTFGGGAYDFFLAKYNSAGVLQWSTYYGGSSDDGYTGGVAVDNAGNIYIGGTTVSSNAISTPGSFQPATGGSFEGFLAKFNSAGVRQWSTYYGGANIEWVWDLAIDAFGNPYMCGSSSSTNAIASPGSHQPTYIGSGDCPFMVKFDPSGNRLWGTYYGGDGRASGITCDVNNDVFVCGYTDGVGPFGLNGYQNASGGSRDGFIAKFNPAGVRQWGTFQGSTGSDQCQNLKLDANGNVFVAGITTSTVGFSFAGPQMSYGGGSYDAFLSKLSPNGATLISCTYKGGSALDYGMDVEIDNANKVYLFGRTQSANNIAFAGYDNTLTGSQNAFLVKYDNGCLLPAQPLAIAGPSALCVGAGLTTYSIAPVGGATSYSWSFPGGWVGSGSSNTIAVTPGSSGIMTVSASNICGAGPTQTLNVIINPLPTITVNSGSICAGQSFTMLPSGANTYTYQGGNAVVNPTANATYTVMGTSLAGCVTTLAATATVIINASPTITVNSGSICAGAAFTLVPSGANTYTFQGGNAVVSPTANASYTVAGTSTNGCVSQMVATGNITVMALPPVTITGDTTICAGMSRTLTSYGADTYVWNTGANTSTIVVSPTVTTSYTVTGTSSVTGCSNNTVAAITIIDCTGIARNTNAPHELLLYPNPTNGHAWLKNENATGTKLEVYNSLGALIYTAEINGAKTFIDLSKQANGLYYLRVGNTVKKLVKE